MKEMMNLEAYKKNNIAKILEYMLLIVTAGIFLIPIVWMFTTSLKPSNETITIPPTLIGSTLAWDNYVKAWNFLPFGIFMMNSFIVSIAVTIMVVITSSLAAYAFARIQFKGRDTLFLLYLGTLMIPQQVTMIPLFIIMKKLGWVDTYLALILPVSFTAFGTFLMRQFFLTIPYELEEAGRIDGCSPFGLFARIVMPMSKPALSTLAIFSFIGQWKNFLWPLIIVNKTDMKTLTLGIRMFQGQYGTEWNLLMCATAIAVIPSIIIFILLQKYLIEGISLTGMGGR